MKNGVTQQTGVAMCGISHRITAGDVTIRSGLEASVDAGRHRWVGLGGDELEQLTVVDEPNAG